MSGSGRPLRFLAVVGSGWIGLRIVMLWPTLTSAPALIRAVVPSAAAVPMAASARSAAMAVDAAHRVRPVAPRKDDPGERPRRHGRDRSVALPSDPGRPVLGRPADAEAPAAAPIIAGLPAPAPTPSSGRRATRWSGSFWLLARGGGGLGVGVGGGQLGGSQSGLRIAYMLDARHRLAAAARLTSPLGRGLRELALGIEWQPSRIPVRIVAEQRLAIDGGRNGARGGPAIGIVGGAGPVAVGGGFNLEGYAQAGVVKRGAAQGFVDAAARVARPIASIGGVRVDLGGGAWGAAQRDARRLDIGPSLSAVLPLGRQPVRLTIDWRERVAGDARPGSGMAVTLGADF